MKNLLFLLALFVFPFLQQAQIAGKKFLETCSELDFIKKEKSIHQTSIDLISTKGDELKKEKELLETSESLKIIENQRIDLVKIKDFIN